jgi:hypothetical protein
MGKQDQQPGSVKTHKTLGFLVTECISNFTHQRGYGPKMGFNTQLNSIKVATRALKSRSSCRDIVVAARAGLGPSVAAFVGV